MNAELQCQVCNEWYSSRFIDFVDRSHFERANRERTLTKELGNMDQCPYCNMQTPVATEYMRWPS